MTASSHKPPIRFTAIEKVKIKPRGLVEICLRRVAANFLKYDQATLIKTLGKQVEDIYQFLDLDMPIPEAATRVNDEAYWKRRTAKEFRNCQNEKHGMSWKQTYLEMELEKSLEQLPVDHTVQDIEALKAKIQSAARLYIYQLRIRQFRSHADLSVLFESLPALTALTLTFGDRHLGMDYERAMFGMKIADAQALARHLRISQTLASLSLPCNLIDDELCKVLISGLSYAHMLTYLDVSHNKIGDRGARRIASLLDPNYCLQHLDLSDNQIHANGCMHIGAHLAENTTLEFLNLRLNRMEDNGVSHLFQDLCVNKNLHTLNISANDLTQRCLSYLSSVLVENKSLTRLDISANPLFGAEVRKEDEDPAYDNKELSCTDPESPFGIFVQCIMNSDSIIKLDMRNCNLPAEILQKIDIAVKTRDLQKRDIPIEAYIRKEEEKVEVEATEPVDLEGEGAVAAEGEEEPVPVEGGEPEEGEEEVEEEKEET